MTFLTYIRLDISYAIGILSGKCQAIVSESSTEAKYKALSKEIKQGVSTKRLLNEL
uniref:Uncharacterized protein n=1 Tax=Physcomitrium patens TaxID=3218 RepID=A0A2K1JXQ3_PHYPA|nr:hypothetical protein PHYPA_013430 [Physcomitrium patens]